MEPFRDYRERLNDGPWDCIIADIPWGYQTRLGGNMCRLVSYPTFAHEDYPVFLQAAQKALHLNRNVWVWTDGYTIPVLLEAAHKTSLQYQGLCAMKRVNLGLGNIVRKQMYYVMLFSNGKPYKNLQATLSEWLGEYQVKRSQKPQAVYDKLLAHSLPPGGRWIDPFPETHCEEYRGPQQTTILRPRLFSL